jgi:hypothetical protein
METDFLSIGMYELPATSRVVARTRDVYVIDIPSLQTKPKTTCTRTAIILDPSADLRVISVVAALHYQALRFRINTIGFAKAKGGKLRWWYGDPATEQLARVPMQQAIKAALFPFDNWTAEPPTLVRMVDGLLDRDSLVADDPLRAVPERYQLGLVQP